MNHAVEATNVTCKISGTDSTGVSNENDCFIITTISFI